ncbi:MULTISPECIES: DUF998 domain-containing protein [unclassified Streptomyces]|uniref:DUF998 domain-containing protein n=1 Tax=unclassified Streptomyces TaxID=2593676 RepID=UPI0036F05136
MARRVWLPLGAAILVVNAVLWVAAEAITAAAWTDPPYSYATNYISDLGVPDCGTRFQGRDICSPAHDVMNVSFMVQGILFALGVVLLARLVKGRARRVITALALAHGAAFVLVGLFHGSGENSNLALAIHVGAAAIGILCANTVAIMAGSLPSLGLPPAYRIFSITVGVLGLLSEVLVGVSVSTAGVFERGGVYSWLLWGAVTGFLVLVERRRSPAMVENVAV